MSNQGNINLFSQQTGNNPNNLNNLGNKQLIPFVITGPTCGTSIASLKQKQLNQTQQMQQQIPPQMQQQIPPQMQQQMPPQMQQQMPPQMQQQMQQQMPQQMPPQMQQQMQQQMQPQMQQQMQQQMPPQMQQQNDKQYFVNKKNDKMDDSMNDYYSDLSSLIMDSDDSELNNIKFLVKDINKGLVDYEPSKVMLSDSSDDDTEKDNIKESIRENKKNQEKKNTTNNTLANYFKETILILFLYILLSQSFIKKGLAKMISHDILINQSGDYTYFGLTLNGIILSTMILFFKNIFITP